MYSTIESQDLLQSLKLLCAEDKFRTYFTKYLKLKELDSVNTQELINCLAELLLIPEYTSAIVKYYSKYLLQFLSFAIPLDSHESSIHSYETHVKNCVVLSLISKNHPDANRFMLQYFEKYPSPFDKDYFENKQCVIPIKKRKITTELSKRKTNNLELVECCYRFLKTNAEFFRTKWNWSDFIQMFYNHTDEMVKWISCNCIAIVTGMNEHQLSSLLEKVLTKDTIITCSLKHYNDYEINQNLNVHIATTDSTKVTEITEPNIFDNVVSVVGILLPVLQKSQHVKHLVQVKSAQSNLRKVALGIAANRAICLQGPVGSSKTALVEYLAALTGRTLGESFIKVQLGDQTDSKMLLGTYRCTDIPGEFVWQPGVLTQAVTEGSWLLLEDIDSASMDIATVITSLLENSYLSVPGFRDTVPITPGFQLFVTQRLISSITGYHKKHSNASSILEKHLLQVNIEPLTQTELIEIVKIQFPSLTTIATRVVDVFMLFSMGHNETINLSRSGRLTSTRDLFKWCARAIIDFDISSQNSALKVFQDAIDIFCCSFPSIDERLRLAKAISTRLGIVETKAEYFCNSYKPNLSLTATNLSAGRAMIQRHSDALHTKKSKFSFTRPSSCLLERIIYCVNLKEPVLLVGETGTGKTCSIQYLAQTIGQKLIVINMNQQSDSADLLGGYKPVDLKYVIAPIRLEFELLFRAFFAIEPNQKFLQHIAICFNSNRWSTLLALMKHSQTAAINRLKAPQTGDKRTATSSTTDTNYIKKWTDIGIKLNKLSVQLKQQSALAFAFIEGSLVKAIEKGHWVLLDEINLANAETLECLSGLLEGSRGSLSLLERGDRKPITRHEKFILFACMNPSTDVGKKDLPAGLRNRFSEFFVEELTERSDLILLVNSYLKDLSVSQAKIENIVKFYLHIRKEATLSLSDGLGHKPHYSLRTLCRALTISSKNYCGTVDRNLYEAFCLSFLTQLDTNSYKIVEQMIAKSIIGGAKDVKSVLKQPILEPKADKPNSFVQFEGYWVSQGDLEPEVPKEYVLTESVRRNLRDLVRVVAIGRLPVLLQGDTSVGKTSLITYLSKSSGNKCVRINNHEHTDLQEYIGSYVADEDGKLVFREGVLVEAMRKGHWVILDELNLAPTDVLEALNRVLDDNRELFIPETQETVKAHSAFMLFATQNPPGAYGGRKMLSRAFRNRFVELHFNEIPPTELEIILHKRCEIPPSYCKKMIACMTDLQVRRRGSAAFAGKHGFITLRDLFRWGERYRLAPQTDKLYDWDQHIADEGYLVLAGRVRKFEERNEIIEVLKKHIKRLVIPDNLFSLHEKTSSVTRKILEKIYEKRHLYKNIVWTFNTRQLAVLVGKALEFIEPVLLVGETGGGKTTVCRLIAENNGQKLITVNCHMHTESSDFIGGLRPVREHTEENKNKLFEWVDGPLLQAMQFGDVFLADEISLADDSVLERLNSLLEPERSLLLAEKGTDLTSPTDSVSITANERFHFIGTMNPGGDFGKKELSPALRNRFTEIWCETCTDRNDLIDIIEHNLKNGLSFGNQEDGSSGIGKSIMDFIEWFRKTEIGKRFTISIRDILTWVNFINIASETIEISETYIHGACLTFLDSFGSGVTGMENAQSLKKLRDDCTAYLTNQITSNCLNAAPTNLYINVEMNDTKFGIKPFYIQKGNYTKPVDSFSFTAPTTLFNALRVLRGLQLNKAILLEGSPGVGKTSLVSALAKITQHKLLRINLSDQTDICDLFGADLPVEGGQGGEFAWRDGPFLQALKNGDWIVLDELNLASQSVLEGLNACLDHRGEIFIPELGKKFFVKSGTRLFACQNPLRQGGSRRGLPKSFLNRFTQVYIDSLTKTDLLLILSSQFPQIPTEIREKMVEFNHQLVHETETHKFAHKGSPWEFNLRDLTRWCQIMLHQIKNSDKDLYKPESSMFLIYGDRMRTDLDKSHVRDVFASVFENCLKHSGQCSVPYVTRDMVYVGDVQMKRGLEESVNLNVLRQDNSCFVLRKQVDVLRSLMYCVNLNWMAILVGASASGKSSVVRTLAQLTGAELRTLAVNSAMDTTDILGGFEQADYNRHLEEISSKTERILLKVVQKCLLQSSNISFSSPLLKKWEKYRAILHTDTEQRTMADETKLFTVKLQQLNEILVSLKSHKNAENFVENLNNLCDRLEKLRLNVEKEGTLNAGGKFEWVDSILIKCLQDGCWLLIENVNLCSPAVLDRLNALLEPNGVLTIGERGVDDNGEMIHIVPHPNFRLFLTIDPKNGEISRAMRNRGVEIYILNETETGCRNVYDTKALIGQNGVQGERFQEILIELHDFICDLLLGEKPTISHILQSSFLISQQLLRGINIIDSYSSSIIDVYVKTKSIHDFNTPDPITTIETQIKTVLQDYLSKNVTESCSPDHKTVKTIDLQTDSNFEQIKQQSVLIRQFLSNEMSTQHANYLLLGYSITSFDNLTLRYSYLLDQLKGVDEKYVGIIKMIFTTLRELYASKIDYTNQTLPLDSRWLPDTIDTYTTVQETNQIFVLLYFIIQKMTNDVLDVEQPGKKYTKMNVLQYSKAVFDKKLSQSSIQQPLIVNFWNLIITFDRFLMSLLTKLSLNIDSNDAVVALTVLNWRFVLRDIGNLVIYDKKDKNLNLNQVLSQLIVRYKWFLKHTVEFFMRCSNKEIAIELSKIIKLINGSLVNNFSNFAKIAKYFTKSSNRPLPLTSQEQIDVNTSIQELADKINLTAAIDINSHQKYDLPLNGISLRQQIFDVNKQKRQNPENAAEQLKSIQEYLTSSDNKFKDTELQMLPVTDYFGLCLVNNLRNYIFDTTNISVEKKCQTLKNISTVPIALCEILESYFETKDQQLLHELTFCITSYFKQCISLSPSDYLNLAKKDEETFVGKYLSTHVPALTYSISFICVPTQNSKDLVATTSLGKNKDKSEQLRYLNELLWQNLPTFTSNSVIKNDAEYIVKSYEHFIILLEKALTGQSSSVSVAEKLTICFDKINEIYVKNTESTEMISNKNKIMTIFEQLNLKIVQLKSVVDADLILETGNVFCLLNYIKILLNTQLQVIDPLEKVVLKKKYCGEEKEICSNLKDAFILQNEIYSGNSKTLHPYCAILALKIQNYELKEEILSKLVAVRPTNIPYQSLLKDVSHNLSTLLSEEFFINMYEKLNSCILSLKEAIRTKTMINLEASNDVLSQSNSWLYSQENSFKKLVKYRVGYPDIIEPILSNITELSYGVRLLNTLLKKLLIQYEYKQNNLDIFMKNMVQFPVLSDTQKSVINLIELCTHSKNISLITKLIQDDNIPNLIKQENVRMLLCGIQEIYNLFVVTSPNYIEPHNKMLTYLEGLINLFVLAWHTQELDRQKKMEDEQSLYKTKTKCENLTEDEQTYKDMKQLFPNFHEQDFSDFQENQLGDTTDDATLSDESELSGVITSDDVLFVATIHSELMRLYTKSEWLNPKKKNLDPNFITPFLQRFKLFTLMQNKIIDGIDSKIDNEIVTSLNLLISITKSYGEGEDLFVNTNSSPRKLKEKNFDFYKDQKVEEIKSCLHILEALDKRIQELLNEWPEHPTLQSISTIISRVYSFSITSPVSRFLTGFEVLLSKCHEWEENAHSGVSLTEYSQSVTLQIIAWRKLELAGWKDCLNNAFDRTRNGASKWWFYIYSTIQQFIKIQNETTTEEVIKIFQEFMEKSSLGEYDSRLGLLYAFHCQVLHLPKSNKTDIVISVLWNLHNFYDQFSNNVDTKIKNLRSPIEKKLKDFVKIARWNDINYWSIKETVEKTHRTLHKYIKEFEQILKQGVTDCLVNSTSDTSEQVGIWDRPMRHLPSEYHYRLEASNYMASVKFKKLLNEPNTSIQEDDDTLLSKSEKYFTKSRNLCKNTILNTSYPNLIQNLDGFITEVIETSTHLRNLEVSKELTKPKQKSQAKSILQQKRKALADLFKTLSKCGLSYRTGIIETNIRGKLNSEFLLKPLDLKASFSYVKNKGSCDRLLLNVWDGCETYFMRTIARFAALETALKQPAPDLGLQNIERCKGFSAHLMILAQDQKSKLIETSRNLYYLRNCLNQLSEWTDGSHIISSETIKIVIEFLTNIIVVMEQYKILLLSCPAQSDFSSDLVAIPVLDQENEVPIKYKYDTKWNKALADIKLITSTAQKLKITVEKLETIFPSSDLQLESAKYIFIQDKSSIIAELESLSDKMNNLEQQFGDNAMSNSIRWLSKEFSLIFDLIKVEYLTQTSEVSVDNFKLDVEKLMENILLVIQNIYKKYSAKQDDEQKPETTEETVQTELFEDNHLKDLVVENLFTDISTLEMKSVFRKVKKLMEKLYKMNATDIKQCKSLVSHCIPLLEQIVLLYQYFVTQQVSAYRVTCKMNAVLLNIFIELASKGFCVPPEFSDEMDSEGQTNQQSGGMGLGEGEGEKDVSEKIESEDQLEDAQPAGQEKKNEDKDCKEEDKGIEMSEDFEGKLQDIDKPEDNESQSNSDNDAEKQMGDTEPDADRLDKQIWGSDEENDEDDEEEEESNKQDKEERGEGGELEDQQMAAKEDQSKQNEEEGEDNQQKEKKNEPQPKDINEMDEPEYDEDQTDPYHGNQPELPEPEPMDLPDDLQLDDGEEKGDPNEENPFDIDTMKEQQAPEEPEEANKEESTKVEEKTGDSDSSDEEDSTPDKGTDDKAAEDEQKEEENNGNDQENEGLQKTEEEEEEKEQKDEETKEKKDSAIDNQQSNEDDIQPMDVDNIESSDNVETNPNQTNAQNSDQISQEQSHDQDGVGQSQMEESETGHRGEVNAAKDALSAQKENEKPQEKRQRPGESDSKRSLGETTEPVKKKMKTVNLQDKEDNTDDAEEEGASEGKDADMYQHIKEAKETDTQVMDAATKEQAETQKIQNLDDEKTEEPTDKPTEMDTDDPEPEVTETPQQKSEKGETKSQKKADGKQKQGDIVEEIKDVEIEGEVVDTTTVSRGNESSYHTQYEILSENQVERMSTLEIQDLRTELEIQLGTWNEPPPNMEAEQTWEKFSAITSSLARDLSEQLRLVLEPTQASRLRGDFRTGRRINMRKVIPYIASQFRKDKIWLRRTKPSKREYQIVLAIDDSSSMDDNHSKELAFESVALISKALSLLESGQLSVLSFGETTEILHKLTDTFTEKSGVKLLQKFQFTQKKTCVANLVDFVTTMFSDTHTSAPNAKLLVVVSDGRGIFSEGETYVQQAIRRAKFANIFMVFVIIDNPDNKNSILDIRMPVFKEGNLLGIKSYLDSFPFPFYMILRDINSLPSVLSDALRQWFELVTNVD